MPPDLCYLLLGMSTIGSDVDGFWNAWSTGAEAGLPSCLLQGGWSDCRSSPSMLSLVGVRVHIRWRRLGGRSAGGGGGDWC